MAVLLTMGGKLLVLPAGAPPYQYDALLPYTTQTTIAQQDYLRGVDPGSLDISVLFDGPVTEYGISTLGDELPEGRTLNTSTGEVTGTPTEATNPTQLPVVYPTATEAGVTIVASNPVSFSVTGPVIEFGLVTEDSIPFSTDTNDGTIYWALSDTASATDAQVIAGTGGDVQTGGSQSVSGSGLITPDLSSYTGTKFLFLLQVAASGAYSNRAVREVVILDNLVGIDLTSGWTATGVSVTGSQSDLYGGTGAFDVQATATNAGLALTSDLSISGDHKAYVLAKADNTNWLRIAFDSTNTWFNLSTGAVATSNHDAAAITSLGGGWYKCEVTHSCDGTANFIFIPANGDNNLAETSGNSFILFKPVVVEL